MQCLKSWKAIIKYVIFLCRHKWYVFIECRKYGLIWQGIIHDLSKFLPSEFFPHLNFFYIQEKKLNGMWRGGEDAELDVARRKHIRRNLHQWQYWILKKGDKTECLPMPDRYRKEMLADWRALNRKDHVKEWYLRHQDTIILHDETKNWLEKEINLNEENQLRN